MNNIAPGLNREFACESWPSIPDYIFKQVREGAKKAQKNYPLKLYGYDVDTWVLRTAENNAYKAGVKDFIQFEKRDARDFKESEEYGFVITNPPYGERLGEKEEIEKLYKKFKLVMEQHNKWEFNILTSYEQFEKIIDMKAEKNRKLYNGKLKCYYYQYMKNDLIKNQGNTVLQEIIRNS